MESVFFWKGERLAEKKMIDQNLMEYEIDNAEKLYDYLNLKLPKSAKHEDLNNLCYTLFCTLDILPKNLQSLNINKKVLAKTFMRIAKENNTEFNNSDKIMEEDDWIDHIHKSMKLDKWPNLANARKLLETK